MDKKEDWNLELSEYIKQGEPNRVEKTKTWETAIGLQDVDGLKPSKYLIKTAKEHIEGTIDIEEAKIRIDEYYEVQDSRKNFEKENEEADKVAVRITEMENAVKKAYHDAYIQDLRNRGYKIRYKKTIKDYLKIYLMGQEYIGIIILQKKNGH